MNIINALIEYWDELLTILNAVGVIMVGLKKQNKGVK